VASTAANAQSAVGSLLHPVTTETFIHEYWEKRHLILAGQRTGCYHDLFSLADVDEILASGAIHPSTVRLVRAGSSIPIASPSANGRRGRGAVLERIYGEFRDGATIVLNGVHEKHEPLGELCRQLSRELSVFCQVNAYLTPASSQGLLTHYDTHDVIVLQVEGSKHWRLFDSPLPLPLKNQPFKRETVEAGALQDEVDLEAGDLIYVPRGLLHDATSDKSISLHLTVGILPLTWASLILRAVETCIEQEPSLRASLPLAFARGQTDHERLEAEFLRLFNLVHTHIDVASAVQEAVETAQFGTSAPASGRLLDLEAESRIDMETRLKRRPEIDWWLSRDGDAVTLRFEDKLVTLPTFAEQDLRFLAVTQEFSVAELPGGLDAEGKVVLVRRLLREGFLTICR
jgi:ribosomal protein L16 Arg81 hydroxylase